MQHCFMAYGATPKPSMSDINPSKLLILWLLKHKHKRPQKRLKPKVIRRYRMRLIMLTSLAIILSSCGGFIQPRLPLPDRPALPKIDKTKLRCLDNQSYKKLVKRDVLQKTHIDRLRAIIKSTH